MPRHALACHGTPWHPEGGLGAQGGARAPGPAPLRVSRHAMACHLYISRLENNQSIFDTDWKIFSLCFNQDSGCKIIRNVFRSYPAKPASPNPIQNLIWH